MTSYQPSHAGICVRDLQRSLRFYCDGLGFVAGEAYELDSATAPGLERALETRGDVKVTSQFIEHGAMRIELLQFHEPEPTGVPSRTRTQLGLTHLCFAVPDVDAAAERLLEFGALVLDTTRSSPGTDIVFVMDPDGVRIELMRGA
jgi:catechol 2,3-dioxygenase-like lactoylglutathione lyase family enzyme